MSATAAPTLPASVGAPPAAATGSLLVACFCATSYCQTCREFTETFATLAQDYPDQRWVWVDVEDDGDLVGDVEIETFPTLAIYREHARGSEQYDLMHFAPSLPQSGNVERLLAAISRADAPDATVANASDEIRALPQLLRERDAPAPKRGLRP